MKKIFKVWIINTLTDEILVEKMKIAINKSDARNKIHKKEYLPRFGSDRLWNQIEIILHEVGSYTPED